MHHDDVNDTSIEAVIVVLENSGRAGRRQRQHRIDRLRIARGAQLFRHVLVAEQPGDSRQGFQVVGAGALGRKQQEDEIDRLAIHRFKVDRTLEAGLRSQD